MQSGCNGNSTWCADGNPSLQCINHVEWKMVNIRRFQDTPPFSNNIAHLRQVS